MANTKCTCPHCGGALTDGEIKTLRARMNGLKGGSAIAPGDLAAQKARQAGRRNADGLTALQREIILRVGLRGDHKTAAKLLDLWRNGMQYFHAGGRPDSLKGLSAGRGNQQAKAWRKYL